MEVGVVLHVCTYTHVAERVRQGEVMSVGTGWKAYGSCCHLAVEKDLGQH